MELTVLLTSKKSTKFVIVSTLTANKSKPPTPKSSSPACTICSKKLRTGEPFTDADRAHKQTLEGIITPEETIIEPVKQKKWPTQPTENNLPPFATCCAPPPANGAPNKSPSNSPATSPKQNSKAITTNLEHLEWFGLILRDDTGSIPHGNYAESTQAA